MKNRPILSATELDAMIAAVLAEASRLELSVAVSLCDDGGHALRLYRMDGTGAMTPVVAAAKARTAALMRAPSGALTARLKDEPELLRLTEYLPMPGGLPIIYDGHCVGGIGISGGSAAQDVAIAEAGRAALETV